MHNNIFSITVEEATPEELQRMQLYRRNADWLSDHWKLVGDGPAVAIEKTFTFANYFETMAFVNAVAFIAHTQDHHPDMSVHYNRCVVRFNTHDVGGISISDFASDRPIPRPVSRDAAKPSP